MSFLAQLVLDLQECRILRIADPYSLHKLVWSLFPPEIAPIDKNNRVLFADRGIRKGKRNILVLSQVAPIANEHGQLAVKPVPCEFLHHKLYHFEIIINAVQKEAAVNKLMPLRRRNAVLEWFAAKASKWGFEIAQTQVDYIEASAFNNAKNHRITLNMAHLHGGLLVLDQQKFEYSFNNGIGKGRAFGCGLLQLQPAFL